MWMMIIGTLENKHSCKSWIFQTNKNLFEWKEIIGYHSSFLTFNPGNLTLNNTCELSEQCIQPFAACFQGKCQCINGYSALDRESCLRGL